MGISPLGIATRGLAAFSALGRALRGLWAPESGLGWFFNGSAVSEAVFGGQSITDWMFLKDYELGVFLNSPHTMPGVDAWEAQTTTRVSSLVLFYELASELPDPAFISALLERGTTPLVTLQTSGYTLDSIISGAHDAAIMAFCSTLVDTAPVMLRPMHEMNGNWYDWGYDHVGISAGNTPTKYIAAFQHLVDVARAAAPNVQIVWCVNRESKQPTTWNAVVAPYFPGDAYIDFLSFDAYNLDDRTGADFGSNDDGLHPVVWSIDGAHYHDGAKALKAITPNFVPNEGVVTMPTLRSGVSPTGAYVATVWVYGTSGTVQAIIKERASNDALIGTSFGTPVTMNGTWQKLTVTRTFTTGTGIRIGVVTPTQQAVTFWADSFSLTCDGTQILPIGAQQVESTIGGLAWQDYSPVNDAGVGLADAIYASVAALSDKPIIIAETSTHTVTQDGSVFVDSMFAWLATHPRIALTCWFDDHNQGYNLDYSPAELEAWIRHKPLADPRQPYSMLLESQVASPVYGGRVYTEWHMDTPYDPAGTFRVKASKNADMSDSYVVAPEDMDEPWWDNDGTVYSFFYRLDQLATYYFTVAYHDSDGWGRESKPSSVLVFDAAPTMPVVIDLTYGGTGGAGWIEASWQPNPAGEAVVGYRFETLQYGTTTFVPHDTTATSIRVDGMDTTHLHTGYVRAIDNTGCLSPRAEFYGYIYFQ